MLVNCEGLPETFIRLFFRPQSVDSWDGGSTDELKKAAVEKKIGKKFENFLNVISLLISGPQTSITT